MATLPGIRLNSSMQTSTNVITSYSIHYTKLYDTRVQDVNQLLKRFTEAQKMMKKMQQLGPKGLKGLMGRGGGFPF